jgi:hypothetical protein
LEGRAVEATVLAPAVRGEHRAWAREVEVVDVAVGVGDDKETSMTKLRILLASAVFGLAASSLAASPAAPKSFSSSRHAAEALVVAADNQDVPALIAIFGADGSALVTSGDEIQDKSDRAKFAELAHEKLDIVIDAKNRELATVVVSNDAWPFPVPLVEKGGKWSFATKRGLREVLDRRIGSNELDALEICRGYVEAQKEYAEKDRNGDEVPEYAQKIISTEGKRDGLVWRNPDGSLDGPIAQGIAEAIAAGYSDKSKLYHGYHFRILMRQGPHAPLGAMDYVIDGKMIGGFALVAWPAEYAVSGVKTFIVGYNGVVYEKDLGPHTANVVAKIDRYDPDKSWRAIP